MIRDVEAAMAAERSLRRGRSPSSKAENGARAHTHTLGVRISDEEPVLAEGTNLFYGEGRWSKFRQGPALSRSEF